MHTRITCLRFPAAFPGFVPHKQAQALIPAVSMLFLFSVAAAPVLSAPTPPPRPVPLMQAVPLPEQQVSFQRDGLELCRYHFGTTARRPFIFPVIGPSRRMLTRMGHPHDPEGHRHHYSIWISHHDIDGLSFWDDRSKGRIVHQRVERLEDAEQEAGIVTQNDWLNETNNQVILTERRAVRVQTLPDKQWMLVIDLELRAKDRAITVGKTPFGMLGVRMAKTIGVNDGGGTIRNSEGGVGEKEILWKHARWVDYSGPVASTVIEGITLLDHPSNPNHPGGFHVRADGWMGASLTLDGPLAIQTNAPLKLRYGLFIHAGQPSAEALDRVWAGFAQTPAGISAPSRK